VGVAVSVVRNPFGGTVEILFLLIEEKLGGEGVGYFGLWDMEDGDGCEMSFMVCGSVSRFMLRELARQ